MDIPRIITPAEGDTVASWMLERYGDGLIALGLGGPEIGNPPQKYRSAFDRMRAAGIPCILHAGETAGAESIWEALTVANSRRIGHGVRAIEDPALMAHLREQQIPLEVCSSSNICLKVFPSLAEHSLPQLLEAGLYVTLNSDDPPMFNTTLNREYLLGQRTWNWNLETIERLVLNAVDATLLPETERQALRHSFEQDFERLIQSSA